MCEWASVKGKTQSNREAMMHVFKPRGGEPIIVEDTLCDAVAPIAVMPHVRNWVSFDVSPNIF